MQLAFYIFFSFSRPKVAWRRQESKNVGINQYSSRKSATPTSNPEEALALQWEASSGEFQQWFCHAGQKNGFVPFQSQISASAFCSKEVLSHSQPWPSPVYKHSSQDKHLWPEKSHIQAWCLPSCPSGHCSQENEQGLASQTPGSLLRFILFTGVYYLIFQTEQPCHLQVEIKLKTERRRYCASGVFSDRRCVSGRVLETGQNTGGADAQQWLSNTIPQHHLCPWCLLCFLVSVPLLARPSRTQVYTFLLSSPPPKNKPRQAGKLMKFKHSSLSRGSCLFRISRMPGRGRPGWWVLLEQIQDGIGQKWVTRQIVCIKFVFLGILLDKTALPSITSHSLPWFWINLRESVNCSYSQIFQSSGGKMILQAIGIRFNS